MAALTALTFDTIAVTFEAPGEALYAKRIGLNPTPASLSKICKRKKPDIELGFIIIYIVHVGNDRDPIFLGTCNGVLSSCYLGGYAMESVCHLGNVCTFKVLPDTPGDDENEPPADPYGAYRPPILSLTASKKRNVASSPSIEYHRLKTGT